VPRALPTCMSACLHACLLACLPACLRACLPGAGAGAVLALLPTLVCCWCGDDPKLRDHDSRRLDSRALSFRAPRGSPARVNHQLESPLTCEQATCEVLGMRHFNLTDPRLEILSKKRSLEVPSAAWETWTLSKNTRCMLKHT
jgi:hypothetical protein